jgi:hypothetical protein
MNSPRPARRVRSGQTSAGVAGRALYPAALGASPMIQRALSVASNATASSRGVIDTPIVRARCMVAGNRRSVRRKSFRDTRANAFRRAASDGLAREPCHADSLRL